MSQTGKCRAVAPTEHLERWGLPPDVVGHNILELVPVAFREATRSCVGRARETGEPQLLYYSVDSKLDTRHLEGHLEVDEPDGFSLVVRDITETRTLEDAVANLLAALCAEREQTVRALLVVCEWCNRVRDERGEWRELGALIEELSLAKTADSICPDCANGEVEYPSAEAL